MNRSKRNLSAKHVSVGKAEKVDLIDVFVKCERRGPVEVTAIDWPTGNEDFIPWTLSTANADGSITVFGGKVHGDNLNDEVPEKKRGDAHRIQAVSRHPNVDGGRCSPKVRSAKKATKPNGSSRGDRS